VHVVGIGYDQNGVYVRDSSGWDTRYVTWTRLYGDVGFSGWVLGVGNRGAPWSGRVRARRPCNFVRARRWLGALSRRHAAMCNRGSGPGSRFLERSAHDNQAQRWDGEDDVAVFDLIDVDDLLIHQTNALLRSTAAVFR
jgi:hypothetical protein